MFGSLTNQGEETRRRIHSISHEGVETQHNKMQLRLVSPHFISRLCLFVFVSSQLCKSYAFFFNLVFLFVYFFSLLENQQHLLLKQNQKKNYIYTYKYSKEIRDSRCAASVSLPNQHWSLLLCPTSPCLPSFFDCVPLLYLFFMCTFITLKCFRALLTKGENKK